MKFDTNSLRNIIRECMEELSESCGDRHGAQMPMGNMEPQDPSIIGSKWNDLVNQCTMTPDPSFRLKVVIPALAAAKPSLWQGIFETINEDPDLQEEIFQAIDDYRTRNKR